RTAENTVFHDSHQRRRDRAERVRERDELRHRGHLDLHRHRVADHAADDESDEDPLIREDVRVQQCADDGEQHAHRRLLHAEPGLRGLRERTQAEDEQDRCCEIRCLDDQVARAELVHLAGSGLPASGFPASGFFPCPFNIASMRAVIRNPALTLVRAQTPATNPRIVEIRPYCPPAATIAPTSEMPEIALVADISGVCSNGGTRWMMMKPTKPARMK